MSSDITYACLTEENLAKKLHDIAYSPETPIWETTESVMLKAFELGHQITRRTLENPDFRITKLCVVPRGGLFVANVLSRSFGMSGDQVLSLGLTRYGTEHPELAGEFKLGQIPEKKLVEGQSVLVVDEVYDTGQTMVKAKDIMHGLGAASVYSGVIHYKPGMNSSGVEPDFQVEETNGWVHYPWEAFDPFGLIYKNALNGNGTPE